eukprot:COSAG06_NODE_18974_length_859_cov_1.207895_1_plen_150_part_10
MKRERGREREHARGRMAAMLAGFPAPPSHAPKARLRVAVSAAAAVQKAKSASREHAPLTPSRIKFPSPPRTPRRTPEGQPAERAEVATRTLLKPPREASADRSDQQHPPRWPEPFSLAGAPERPSTGEERKLPERPPKPPADPPSSTLHV